jgi:hypothetical protein
MALTTCTSARMRIATAIARKGTRTMAEYIPLVRKVQAWQYSVYSKDMIPNVVYQVDWQNGIKHLSNPYIFIDDADNTYHLKHDDYVVSEDDEEGNTIMYVLAPEVFEATFVKCEEVE